MGIWSHVLAGGARGGGKAWGEEIHERADTKKKMGIMAAQDESADKRMTKAQELSDKSSIASDKRRDASTIAKEERADKYMDDEGNIITLGQFNKLDPTERGKFKDFKTIEYEGAQAKALLDKVKADASYNVSQAQLKNAEAAATRAETAAKLSGGKSQYPSSVREERHKLAMEQAKTDLEAYKKKNKLTRLFGDKEVPGGDATWLLRRTDEILGAGGNGIMNPRDDTGAGGSGSADQPTVDDVPPGGVTAASIMERVNRTSGSPQAGTGLEILASHDTVAPSDKGIMPGPVTDTPDDAIAPAENGIMSEGDGNDGTFAKVADFLSQEISLADILGGATRAGIGVAGAGVEAAQKITPQIIDSMKAESLIALAEKAGLTLIQLNEMSTDAIRAYLKLASESSAEGAARLGRRNTNLMR
ncbi:hypothetical protein KAR91_83520 [Candidatus Pacearchaeota archaeon]|nr:hypothetical protein [Candidatus Pacearchaeota archaeon]